MTPVTTKKTRHLNLNVDVFRCVLLFYTIYFYIGYVDKFPKLPNLDYIIITWACVLLLCDFIYKQELLHMKQAWCLIIYMVFYVITININRNYMSNNVIYFLYTMIYLLVLIPPDRYTQQDKKYRSIFTFFFIFLIPVTILSTMSMWAHITRYGYYVPVRNGPWIWFGYAQRGRLIGFYPNPNYGGLLSFVAVCALVINLTLIKKIFNNKWIVYIWRTLFWLLLPIHFTMMTLTDSRASRIGLIAFAFFFTFFCLLRMLAKKIKLNTWIICLSVCLAVIITGVIYLIDQPVRNGFMELDRRIENNQNSDIEQKKLTRSINQNAYALSIIKKPDFEKVITPGWIYKLTSRDILKDIEDRFELIKFGIEVIKIKPIFGTSPASLYDEVLRVNKNRPENRMVEESSIRTVKWGGLHNAYVQLAATNGLPTLMLFLIFLGTYIFRNFNKLMKNIDNSNYLTAGAILSLCIAYMVWSLLEARMLPYSETRYFAASVVFFSSISFTETLLQKLPERVKSHE